MSPVVKSSHHLEYATFPRKHMYLVKTRRPEIYVAYVFAAHPALPERKLSIISYVTFSASGKLYSQKRMNAVRSRLWLSVP